MNIIPVIIGDDGEELNWDRHVQPYERLPVALDSIAYTGNCYDGDEPSLIMFFKIKGQETAS